MIKKNTSRKPKSKVTNRTIKKVVSKTRKTTQKPSSKARNYQKAYDMCVQKAMQRLGSNKINSKKSRRPKNTKSASKQKQASIKDEYKLFLKKHMKDKNLANLPYTEKMKEIAKMWKLQK